MFWSVLCYRTFDLGMENFELGVAKAKEIREDPEKAGFHGKSLQIFLWRYKRAGKDAGRSETQAYWTS